MEKIKSLDLFKKGFIDFDGFKLERNKINVITGQIGIGKNFLAKTISKILNDSLTTIKYIEYSNADKNNSRIKNVFDDVYALKRLKETNTIAMLRPLIYIIADIDYMDLIKLNKVYDLFIKENICVVVTIDSHEMQTDSNEFNLIKLTIVKNNKSTDSEIISININEIDYNIGKEIIDRNKKCYTGMRKYLLCLNQDQYDNLLKVKQKGEEQALDVLKDILRYKEQSTLNVAKIKTMYIEDGRNYVEYYCI